MGGARALRLAGSSLVTGCAGIEAGGASLLRMTPALARQPLSFRRRLEAETFPGRYDVRMQRRGVLEACIEDTHLGLSPDKLRRPQRIEIGPAAVAPRALGTLDFQRAIRA